MTRICPKCGLEKLLAEFPRRSDRPDGRGTICLACGREYRKAHYAKNVAYYVAKAFRARLKQRAMNYDRLLEYLRAHPCVDCGERDVRVLQFDHVDPSTKTTEVSKLLLRHSWRRVLSEIEKCVVRCGNCHRRKTLRELRMRGDRIGEDSAIWVSPVWAIPA